MKRSGLKNRFPHRVFEFWQGLGWYEDLISGKNNADCLHHIISPSSSYYIPGKHNSSIFNSCPLSNFETHLYNPNLHKPEMEKKLLKKVAGILIDNGYQIKKIDVQFYRKYQKLYK